MRALSGITTMDTSMSVQLPRHTRMQPQNDGSIESMTTMERGTRDQHITVEVSNRRLPVRMIAGRLLNDLRHSGDVLQSRHGRNGRLA